MIVPNGMDGKCRPALQQHFGIHRLGAMPPVMFSWYPEPQWGGGADTRGAISRGAIYEDVFVIGGVWFRDGSVYSMYGRLFARAGDDAELWHIWMHQLG